MPRYSSHYYYAPASVIDCLGRIYYTHMVKMSLDGHNCFIEIFTYETLCFTVLGSLPLGQTGLSFVVSTLWQLKKMEVIVYCLEVRSGSTKAQCRAVHYNAWGAFGQTTIYAICDGYNIQSL